MSKLSKIPLYLHTVSHLKPSQVLLRVKRRMGGLTKLKGAPSVIATSLNADISRVPVLAQLDFCPLFIGRFDVEGIMNDEIRLLHHTEMVDWGSSWRKELSTPLWSFNYQYQEYLLPLAKAFLDTHEDRYINKAKQIISSWIKSCPIGNGGSAWSSYTISLRVMNWLSFYGELRDYLAPDADFVEMMNSSLAEQYVHLSNHLEIDLLANHYLENLKALVVLSCYFCDREYFKFAYKELKKQVREQILSDGMHFELSPMYHKIVFEDLLRVASCVKCYDSSINAVADLRLQSMADCLFSMERNANRTPLFNDAGDNVAKGKEALLTCASEVFSITPVYKSRLDDAGYVFLERRTNHGVIKLIFDAGQAGPSYAMGHAHCDALSIECYIDGKPWIVNLGTYAYQDQKRLDFKATRSHSTVFIDGEEQYECWAPFRVARYGKTRLVESDTYSATAEFFYPNGKCVRRRVCLGEDGLELFDAVKGEKAIAVYHFEKQWGKPLLSGELLKSVYAPEFGKSCEAFTCVLLNDEGKTNIPYPAGIAGSYFTKGER